MVLKVLLISFAILSLTAASGYYAPAPTTQPTPPTCGPCPVNDCGFRPFEFRYTCPNGNILDRCGCAESCQCDGCRPFDLNLPCEHGKKTDSKGCPLSICNPPPCEFAIDCAAVTCPAEFGTAVDSKNCPLRGCPCQGATNCPAVNNCDIDCSKRGGYRLDSHNCVTCQCANKPGSCPKFGAWGSKVCSSDYDCKGDQKCCKVNPYYPGQKRCHGSSYSGY